MTDDEYGGGQEQRENYGDGSGDGDVPKPQRKLEKPQGVEGLIDEVDALLDGQENLQERYRQRGAQ